MRVPVYGTKESLRKKAAAAATAGPHSARFGDFRKGGAVDVEMVPATSIGSPREARMEGIGEAMWDGAMRVRGVDGWIKPTRGHRTVHAWQGTVVL